MSVLDDEMARQIATLELLYDPVREYRFAPPRLWRFDFAWPSLSLALEVEGGTWCRGGHTRGVGFYRNAEKYNAATLAGWRILGVTSNMVRDGEALALVTRAMEAFGGA